MGASPDLVRRLLGPELLHPLFADDERLQTMLLRAFERWQQRLGSGWKSAVLHAWRTNDFSVSEDDADILTWGRERFGPDWLAWYELPQT